jgi:sugar phosphate isomerase/epimerase
MDVYWVTKAGHDPLALLKKYPGRFPLLHLKDATAAPERRMVDVGGGAIDWRTILTTAGNQGLQHAFVEHDQPAEPLASARASFAHLSSLKL